MFSKKKVSNSYLLFVDNYDLTDEEQAELIISYREKNGRFESIEETAQIEGILPVTYKTLEEFTYVD